MANVIVLGAGLVGSVIAQDLARDSALQVTVVDIDPQALAQAHLQAHGAVHCVQADLRDELQVGRVIREADLVVGAVPGWLGYSVLREAIVQRRCFVDISFMPEDPRRLQAEMVEAGIVGFVDFGVAPGMSNVLAARAVRQLDQAQELSIYVGGLPQVRRLPYEYALVFSGADVIEEYTREARLVEGGKIVTRPALSDVEWLDFPGVGTLEAFNTDGLRSLLWTLDVPMMREKTLRYPGHADRIRVLRDAGFLSSEQVEVDDQKVRPVDLALRLLTKAWQLPEGEGDLTVLRVEASGTHEGQPTRHIYDLLDRYDPSSNTTSMARTTGYPCAAMARLLLAHKARFAPGLYFPESLVHQPDLLSLLLEQLSQRGLRFTHEVLGRKSAC